MTATTPAQHRSPTAPNGGHNAAAPTQPLPLHGIRIVDLTSVIFGPLASQVLADYGAEVIKIEAPEGDSTRRTGPAKEDGMSVIFLGVNRNKRSVVLDLKRPAAREALQCLIAQADVLMHSMRPQKLAALGLDPQALLMKYPRLVYAGLHGFGEGGPYAGRPAYDDIIQGMAGLPELVQRQTGDVRYLPTLVADKTSGHVAAHAILAALLSRERSDRGGFVEIPMFETVVAYTMVEHLYGRHFEPPLTDAAGNASAGYPRVLTPWRRPWPTLDGHICMMPYTNAHWRRFFVEVGRPQWIDDPRFCGIAERTENVAALLEAAGGFVAQRSTAQWLAICDRLQIPAGPVAALDGLIDDEQLRAVGFFTELPDAAMGLMRHPGVPVRFDGYRPPIRSNPPRLGEHTREVLLEAGLTNEQIDIVMQTLKESTP